MRRFTRLTNGFSRKVENLAHAVSLHFMHYNFARPHATLRALPADVGDGCRGGRSHLVSGRDRGAAGLAIRVESDYDRRTFAGDDALDYKELSIQVVIRAIQHEHVTGHRF